MGRARKPVRASTRRNTAARRVLRNRRRPNYFLYFCLFVLVSTVAGSITYALTAPQLNVAKVDIKGVQLADKSAIETAAASAIGHNIILLRTGPILKKASCLSEVSQIKMGRKFPNTMWLRVWERKADAVLVTGSGCYLVQSDGYVFHKVPSAVKGVPVVEVVGNQGLKVGRMAASPSIKCALRILALARRQEIELGKISVDPRGDICLNMVSDFRVKLGQPDDISRKMTKLRTALTRRPSIVREGDYLDLSVPDAPAFKRKVASLTAS